MQYENVYVDIPDKTTIGIDDGGWINVANFNTKEDAVAWIRANIGHCDDDGNVCLITLGERKTA